MKLSALNPKHLIPRINNKMFPYETLHIRPFKDLDSISTGQCDNDGLKKSLDKCINVLANLDVQYSLGRGTLLGLYRDQKFIPGDTDLDIDVFGDKDVFQIIQNMSMELVLINTCHARFMQVLFHDIETNALIDLYFYHKSGNSYLNRNIHGYFNIPQNKVENMTKLSFKNEEYSVFDPEWYCKYWYGENWNVPQNYEGHWSLAYKKDCSGFNYKKNIFTTIID